MPYIGRYSGVGSEQAILPVHIEAGTALHIKPIRMYEQVACIRVSCVHTKRQLMNMLHSVIRTNLSCHNMQNQS